MIVQCLLVTVFGTGLLLADSAAAGEPDEHSVRIAPSTLALDVGMPTSIGLPDETTLDLIVTGRRSHPSGNISVLARPVDDARAGYLLALTGQANGDLVGTVLTPGHEYRLVAQAGSLPRIEEVRIVPTELAWRDDVIWHTEATSLPAMRRQPGSQAGSQADTSTTSLNVLVLYTAAARGGRSDAEWTAFLDNLFAVTNDAYARSGTLVDFNRVGAQQVAASETVSSMELLSQLMWHGAAFDAAMFGQVEDWRLAADAHLVALLRLWQPSQSNCGAAGVPACGDDAQCYNAGLGYSVTSLGDCSQLMLAHELGHNLGSAHEPGLDWSGTYPYSHAHVTPAGVGTVMSRTASTLAAQFSAPAADCDGHPCGIEEVSDNARSLRQARHYVARWITDRSITLLDFAPSQVTRGRSLLVNFLWFGVITPRFHIDLHRDGAPIARLSDAESLPRGFKLLSIPDSLPLGPGYSLRVTAADLPGIYTESGPFELVLPTGPPSVLSLGTAVLTAPPGATFVALSVQRAGGAEGMVRVEFETVDGSARAGPHYTATSGSFIWPDGVDGEYSLTVPLTAGAARGQARTFSVVLRNPSAGATLGTPSATVVTITAQPGSGGGGGALGPWSLLLAGILLALSVSAPTARRRQSGAASGGGVGSRMM